MVDIHTQNTPQSAVSSDAVAMMKFQSSAKSTGTAYLLWFFLGGLGAQRFYLGNAWLGALVAVCTLTGLFLLVPLVVPIVISVYDLFTLPSQVRKYNSGLMAEIVHGRGN